MLTTNLFRWQGMKTVEHVEKRHAETIISVAQAIFKENFTGGGAKFRKSNLR